MTESSATTDPATDTATAAPTTGEATTGELFTVREIESFDQDDISAGSAIGKMLATLFLYTVIVMSLVTYWTYSRSLERDTTDNAATANPD